MNILTLLLILFLVWYFLIRKGGREAFINTRPELEFVDAPYSYFLSDSQNFINFNLEENPIGNASPFPSYIYWKFNELPEQDALYSSCNQYRCSTPEQNGYVAEPNPNLLKGDNNVMSSDENVVIEQFNLGADCGYYENPVMYCNNNPISIMCPNNWLTATDKAYGPAKVI